MREIEAITRGIHNNIEITRATNQIGSIHLWMAIQDITMIIQITMTEMDSSSNIMIPEVFPTTTEVGSITLTEVVVAMRTSHHHHHYPLKECHFTMEMVMRNEIIRIVIMIKVDTSMIEITMDIRAILLLHLLTVGIIVIRMIEMGITMTEMVIMVELILIMIGMLMIEWGTTIREIKWNNNSKGIRIAVVILMSLVIVVISFQDPSMVVAFRTMGLDRRIHRIGELLIEILIRHHLMKWDMSQNAIREWMILLIQVIDGVLLMLCHMINSNSKAVWWAWITVIISRMDLQHPHQHRHCHILKIIEHLVGNNNHRHNNNNNIHSITWTKGIFVITTITLTTTMLTSLIRRYSLLNLYQIDNWTRVQMDSTNIIDKRHLVDQIIVLANHPIKGIKGNMNINIIIGLIIMEIVSNTRINSRISKVEINLLEQDSRLEKERELHLQEQVQTQIECIVNSFPRENNSNSNNKMIQWISRTDNHSKITLIIIIILLGNKQEEQEGVLQTQLIVDISSSQTMLAFKEEIKANSLRSIWI